MSSDRKAPNGFPTERHDGLSEAETKRPSKRSFLLAKSQTWTRVVFEEVEGWLVMFRKGVGTANG
jgi:hypothetical protein